MKAALVEKEAVGREGAEIERFEGDDRLAQLLHRHRLFDARQGQMRREGALLGADAERRGGSFGGARECGQLGRRFDSGPEYARRVRIGKEADYGRSSIERSSPHE